MKTLDNVSSVSKLSHFSEADKMECYIVSEAPIGLNFLDSLKILLKDYEKLLVQNYLNKNTEIFLRFYFSDISNQVQTLRQYLFFTRKEHDTFYSCIGQPPASGSKISLLAYHIKAENSIRKSKESEDQLNVYHGNYHSIWMNVKPGVIGSSQEQTQKIFQNLSEKLKLYGGEVEKNVFRTWCYIRDIDNNYQGFVDAREDYFHMIGLNKDTHTIASTGIEGCNQGVADLVTIESLAILGLEDEQIEYMNALDHLCPTYDYNVSFERATRIIFGDRSHYYISGTASIDNKGDVLHKGNVVKQADRILENINALLEPYGATLKDMRYLTVYLRDSADFDYIRAFLEENFPTGLSYVIVRGAVCRPEWLIEMDAVAISSKGDERFAPFVSK